MREPRTDTDAGDPRLVELELAALRRDVDVKAAYNEYLERMLVRVQEAEAWLRNEITRVSEALVLAQADVRAERAAAEQMRTVTAGQDAALEAMCNRVVMLESTIADLHAELARAGQAAAEARTLLESERSLVGNRIARRIVTGLQRFPRTLAAIQRLLRKLLGPV